MTIAKTKVTIMKMANPFQNRSEDSVFDDDFSPFYRRKLFIV